MSDQWEKYVPAAMRAGHDAFFATERYGDDGELVPVKRGDVWRATTEAILAAVGPLIVEDTRERLVAAAARAIERDPGGLVHLRCPHCGGELYVETESTGGYYSEDRIDRIECERFECGATWDRSGVALLKPRKVCSTCETSQRPADDLGGKVPPHDRTWGGRCPGDAA